MFSHDSTENWSIRVYHFAYAHNTQPITHWHVSPYEIAFHT